MPAILVTIGIIVAIVIIVTMVTIKLLSLLSIYYSYFQFSKYAIKEGWKYEYHEAYTITNVQLSKCLNSLLLVKILGYIINLN